ncbi:MAG: hydantoinase/oxoprolinase family protein [Planctomycetes bacterium]|nr:hydantoinase/oxoprolinase family protein [Planctomycetota bacterium]MCW8134762.1 hydantoinase/oxoprolinase family protein [Planctomycetota bacterium]
MQPLIGLTVDGQLSTSLAMPEARIQTIAAVDVGGTFTDAIVIRDDKVLTCKVPSTPRDPGIAVGQALQRLGGADLLIHGTTVATNALLTGRLGRIALITTKGFRDVLAIGRQNRDPRELYALEPAQRQPLVPRELRLEVAERVGPGGEVELALSEGEIAIAVGEVLAAGVQACAVCLLHSYANPAHENLLGARLKLAGVPHVLSSQLAPEFREYERSLVTAANAGLLPLMREYLAGLEARVKPARVVLMHSAGGWLPAEIAALEPVKLALSGPAGGIAGVRKALDMEGLAGGVAFDVGGTSTDVSLVQQTATLRPVTEIAGLPLRTPSLDIHTIGAGGGSIAWLDAGNALHVGPQSAGAEPGPACYGKGGKAATLTDALLVRGRIPRELKLGGEIGLQYAPAEAALAALGMGTAKAAAQAVLQVALAGIERALRRVTVERGVRADDLPLVPFGGAGGLIACDLAELLGTATVLVPRHPGLLCALGMLFTPASRDLSRTLLLRESADLLPMAVSAADELAARATRELLDCKLNGPFTTAASLDVRYVGQSFELNVPLKPDWRKRFEQAHEREFGFARKGEAVEIVNVRVRVAAKHAPPKLPAATGKGKPEPVGQSAHAPVFERVKLGAGATIKGPAIVTELSSCLYVKEGWTAKVTRQGQILVTRNKGPERKRRGRKGQRKPPKGRQ